jgi:mRNA-degrading endonuclease RelE of RelBE toxin-antitoxin system
VKYQIQITDKIIKKLAIFPRKDKERIIDAIDSLAENPRPDECKKLKGDHTPPRYRT